MRSVSASRLLLMFHVVSTRIAESVLDVNSYYSTVLIVQWMMLPWLGVVQATAVLTVWIHACIGIHFWWRTKPWYPAWRAYFFGFALLLPALALAGYVTAGNQVLREAKNPDYAQSSLDDANLTDKTLARDRPDRADRPGPSPRFGGVAVRARAGCAAGTTAAAGRRCWPTRAGGPSPSWPAPPCSRPCAKTASRMPRSAADARAAPPAAFW